MKEVREQEETASKKFPVRRTVTNDNGKELCGHDELAADGPKRRRVRGDEARPRRR